MFANVVSQEDALRESIEALREIVSLYDQLGLMFPAVHAATALHAAHAALEEGGGAIDGYRSLDTLESL